MYHKRHAQQFCKDDPSEIENFTKAEQSEEMYDLHHRKETDLNVSKKWLIDHDLYYNRPASELIFLTRQEHSELHSNVNHYLKGKHLTEETKNKISESRRGRGGLSGSKNPIYGKTRELNPNYKKICPLILYYLRSVAGMTIKEIAERLEASNPKIIKELRHYGI